MALDGATSTFLPYTLNGLQDIAVDSSTVSTLQVNSLTPNRVVVSDSSNFLVSSSSTSTEVDYLSGTTSNLQTQLNTKASTSYLDTNFLNKTTATEQTITAASTFNSTVTANYFYTNNSYNWGRPSGSYNAWAIGRILNGGVIRDLQFKDDTANQTTLLLSSSGQTVYVGLTCDYGTASKVPVWDANKKLVSSGTDSIKISYLDNVSSDIQTQLNSKANTSALSAYALLAGNNNFTGSNSFVDNIQLDSGLLFMYGDAIKWQLEKDFTTSDLIWINSETSTQVMRLNFANNNVRFPYATASRVAVFDSNKALVSSGVSTTTLTYLDATSSIQTQLDGKLNLTGGTLSGALIVDAGVSVGTRFLGTPDGSPGNFWMGLRGSGTEVERLAISIAGPVATGIVTGVTISKPLYLTATGIVANRAVFLDGDKILKSSATTSTELGYVSGVTSAIQTQINTVSGALANYLPLAGGTLTGTVYNSVGNFHPYKGGDTNKGVYLFANNADGATYASYNGGLGSWSGIGFFSSFDSTTRFVFNTRDGTSSQTGKLTCVGIDTTSTIQVGLASNTTASIKLANSLNHITGNASEAYLFNGVNGYMAIGRNTTRSATEANLHMGTTGVDASIESIASNGTAYLPLYFYASKYYFSTGNVGIGTNAPSTPLEVVGSGSLISARNTGTGDNYAGMRLGNDTGYGCYWFLNSSGRTGDGGVSTATIRNDLGSLRLQSNAGNGIFIANTTGNVGIGTTNPLCSLYNIATTGGWRGMSYFGNENTGIVAGAYDNKAYIGGHSGALNAWTDTYLNPSGGGARVRVGGTTAPTYQLDVTGDVSASGSLLFGSGTYTAGCIYSDSSWGCIIRAKTAGASAHFLWTTSNDAYQMRISSSGVLNFHGGATASSVPNGNSTTAGALVIGAVDRNYNDGWNTGLLMETSETTGISVHDSGEKLASFMYYNGDNRFVMGKDAGSGWGTTPIQIDSTLYVQSNLYYNSPPFQSVVGVADSGLVLGWDYSNSRVTRNQIEAYHSGPANNYQQVNWNGLNRTSQFYKESYYSGLLITGYATSYVTSAGFQDIQIRLYNQSTGAYYYFASYQFYNVTYNHAPTIVNINAGALPTGWYDVYTYIAGGGQGIDSNDVISLTYTILPNTMTSS